MSLARALFGENLTIAGLESARMLIGDRLALGSVILEVTSPRIPCVTLAARMGRPAVCQTLQGGGTPGRVLPRDPGRFACRPETR